METVTHYLGLLAACRATSFAKGPGINSLAEHFERKSKLWSVAFNVCALLIAFNAVLFLLYVFTPIKGPFTLVFGFSAYNLWISVGAAMIVVLVASTAYTNAHGYARLSGWRLRLVRRYLS